MTITRPCFHCGLLATEEYQASVNNALCDFCCPACRSVALAISSGGLGDYYRYRDGNNLKAEQEAQDYSIFDRPDIQNDFVVELENGDSEALLQISGIACAACAWLIENRLQLFSAVKEVHVNATNYRARVVWKKKDLSLSEIFTAIAHIGYRARPSIAKESADAKKKESKLALMRLGVAGIGMMQVGMYAIALHAGEIQGMESQWQHFFRWVSLLVVTPVVLFSAWPFFQSAGRALKQGHLNMDVPVALAIGLAYLASIWATLTRAGDVYFDSVSMFTFFLLLGRFLEMKVRHSSALSIERTSQMLPRTVSIVNEDGVEVQLTESLKPDDLIVIAAGDMLPCDGVLKNGESHVDESILTGESLPVLKTAGDQVYAGSINGESPLRVRVTAVANYTKVAAIEKLIERALTEKPRAVTAADRIARHFVLGVLFVAAAVGIFWWFYDSDRAFWVVLSVLVATCPCALSLATPAALTAGTLALKKIGILVNSGHFVENILAVNTSVFDKTGTLTEGKMSVAEVRIIDASWTQAPALNIVAALELNSRHPIASAFQNIIIHHRAQAIKVTPGGGVSGEIQGQVYAFGRLDFVSEDPSLAYPGDGMWQCLTQAGKPIAWVLLEDKPRSGIAKLRDYLSKRNIRMLCLSGDRTKNVEIFSQQWNLIAEGAMLPEQKLARVQAMQAQGENVLVVGDGINDVPILSAANVSLAMGDATQLAKTHADAVLLSGDLAAIPKMFNLAHHIQRKVTQNLSWAVVYNGSILPLAAMGLVPPYLAAIGMSLSSLLVVANAVRLNPKQDLSTQVSVAAPMARRA